MATLARDSLHVIVHQCQKGIEVVPVEGVNRSAMKVHVLLRHRLLREAEVGERVIALVVKDHLRNTGVTGRLLTAREVADLLGVSAETVLRWTRRGELPAIRLPGGAIRFRQDELDGWLEQRATPGEEVSTTPLDAAQRGS